MRDSWTIYNDVIKIATENRSELNYEEMWY